MQLLLLRWCYELQAAVDTTSASAAWTHGEASSGSKATTGSGALFAAAPLQNRLTSWVSKNSHRIAAQ
jgi:hypothetical protein